VFFVDRVGPKEMEIGKAKSKEKTGTNDISRTTTQGGKKNLA